MKTKSLLLTAIFSLLLVSGAWAQEKYEYCSIVYSAYSPKSGILATSIDGKYQEEKLKIEEGNIATNLLPVLTKVNELANSGWEVYNNSALQGGSIYYFLRKKKN